MAETIKGELELDNNRVVIYFHNAKDGCTVLRICNLPTPIPNWKSAGLDITHMINCNWQGKQKFTINKTSK